MKKKIQNCDEILRCFDFEEKRKPATIVMSIIHIVRKTHKLSYVTYYFSQHFIQTSEKKIN